MSHLRPNLVAVPIAAAFAFQLLACAATTDSAEERMDVAAAMAPASSWSHFGNDLAGSRFSPDETALTPENVGRLKPKWVFEAGLFVSSQPILVDGVVYFGSFDGNEYAVDAETGEKIWEFNSSMPSRGAAAYADGTLYFGNLFGNLYALDAKTGEEKWNISLDDHPDAISTSSPIYHDGRIYMGVSSSEENKNDSEPSYECCTFRGSVNAYDAKTGERIWRHYTVAEPTERSRDEKDRPVLGPSGVGVWGTVAVHPEERRVYYTTGNEYTRVWLKAGGSIGALDMDTGKPIWTYLARPSDDWNFDCEVNAAECAQDWDFGTVPLSFTGANGRRLIGAGQTSGWFYALDPKDGSLVWRSNVGAGEIVDDIVYGNATDGERVYVANGNLYKLGEVGAISALDGATGTILWQTPSPDGGSHHGPIAVTGTGDDKLIFAGSAGRFVRAYAAKDGKPVWEFETAGAVAGGAAIVDGVVYIGTGFSARYAGNEVGAPDNKLYAFSLDGK